MKLRRLGLVDHRPTCDAMRRFTAERSADTEDELWILQHRPVYTVGVAGRDEHLPRDCPVARSIPVQRIDRGGQITYHGPGQAIVYTLLDLTRNELSVRSLVRLLEQSVIDCLADYNIVASRRAGAPGIYVDSAGGAKVAALGLRVRRGCCYHGVALNVDMDLEPFAFIDPCGYPGLAVTQTSALGIPADAEAMGGALAQRIVQLIESNHASR